MGGYDDHVAMIDDWMLPSPSPRGLFSSLIGDDILPRSFAESGRENKPLPPGSERQIASGSSNVNDELQASLTGDEGRQLNTLPEQRTSYHGGGLLERRAARGGFNAPRLNTESIRPSGLAQNQQIRSPYLTIPPGLSPTILLDSPVFLSNSLVQPSPTTGKVSIAPTGNNRNSMFMVSDSDKGKENIFEDVNASSFAFKPFTDSGSSMYLGAVSKVAPSGVEVLVHSENSIPPQNMEPQRVNSLNKTTLFQQPEFSNSSAEKTTDSNISSELRTYNTIGVEQHSLPLDEPQEEGTDQSNGDSSLGNGPSDDGYNWRKYGQKQVKGSEYPRSYYKCTHPSCQVKKKVERSHEGHITEIIYKGTHNHPKPPPNRRSAIGSSNSLGDMQLDTTEQTGPGANRDSIWSSIMQKGTSDWKSENLERTSSAPLAQEYGSRSISVQAPGGTQFESGDAVDGPSMFSNEEDEDDRVTYGSTSLGHDAEDDESESKRRRIETYASEISGATRAIREPRVVVQTTSEVDILDDGYRWRKYGQKVVKGNPNPRSYYKCTSPGCTVRKHVERASHDLKSVITTYEGKHNHDVPAARNSSHSTSGVPNMLPNQALAAAQSHVHRPEHSQIRHGFGGFERPHSLGAFGFLGRPQLGPNAGFGFRMNQPSLTNVGMAGMGPNQGNLPVLPVHPYGGQLRPMNDMGFMLPKAELKTEPGTDSGIDASSSSSVYQQIMNRLPLGPQM